MIARAFSVARLVYGGWLVVDPDGAVRLTLEQPTPASRIVFRVLGARHVVQATTTLLWPDRRVLEIGSVIDALHSATGLAFGSLDHGWRRGARIDALVATTFATVGAVIVKTSPCLRT